VGSPAAVGLLGAQCLRLDGIRHGADAARRNVAVFWKLMLFAERRSRRLNSPPSHQRTSPQECRTSMAYEGTANGS
jgi:hypothetical protein